MQLHYNQGSPYVRLVCVVAHECELLDQIELLGTGPLSPVEAHLAVSAANPLGRIPVLVTVYTLAVACVKFVWFYV